MTCFISKCKKFVAWVLAIVVLAGLGGCGRTTQNAPSQSAGSAISSDSVSSVETISSAAYVPQDRFEEDFIPLLTEFTRQYFAQNPLTGSLGAATNWAILFVTQNYKAYSPKYIYADSLSSSSPDPSIFINNETAFVLSAFCVNFEADGTPDGLTPEEDGSYNINLQVVAKEDKDHRLTLLGFVTNQTRQINRPSDLAEFLKVLPEYANLKVAAPKPDAPLEAVNLTDKTGGLRILDIWPAGDALYVFGYDPDERLIDGKHATLYLKAYSAGNLSLLYERSFPSSRVTAPACFAEAEGLIFTSEREGGQPYYLATESGIKEVDYTPADEKADKIFRLSDTAVIIQSGIDLLLEKDGAAVPILKGVPNDGYDGNIDEISRYLFRYRIDDSSFVYAKIGWEWVSESGIYNIETGKTTIFTHKNAHTLVPISVQSGNILLVPYRDSVYTSFGPYLYDLASGQMTDLGWFDETFYQSSSSFLYFNDTITSFSKTPFGISVLLCDLTRETTPRRFDVFDENSAEPTKVINAGGYLWYCFETAWFSDAYLLRFPIEKTNSAAR